MAPEINQAEEIGFCFGVRRAIRMLEKAAGESGRIESLGEVVHNEQVLQNLEHQGVTIIQRIEDISQANVAISAHGVTPAVEAELRARDLKTIDTTCPFVRRAQQTARKLVEEGYYVVIYGNSEHQEVKGILGWAQGEGLATTDIQALQKLEKIPLKIGVLSQTTQIPENFSDFTKRLIDLALAKDGEIRIVDTICHDIRRRQSVSAKLAKKADLILVIGGRSSANTRRLLELCSYLTEAHQIQNASEIDPDWLKGKNKIGITSGTSTPDQTIEEVVKRLESIP
jgi:4-hydroxy-3-methylbut-2-en-1-yl diphosphate reductase